MDDAKRRRWAGGRGKKRGVLAILPIARLGEGWDDARLNQPFVNMSKKRVFKRGCITVQRWPKALDADLYDQYYAAAMHHVRKRVLKISLMEAERRSGLCHQFWSKVEKAKSHPNSHSEVLMSNALHVRPHVIHRLAERWMRQGRKLEVLLALLGLFEATATLPPGA